ncbi:MAG TPA: response regulator [Anaerolineae bacterium]|nr:response regulator [Anaerolineae bacterium]
MTTILVIDDDASIRNNLLDMLETEGFKAAGAENGLKGVHLAQASPPDLVICDIMMPELDGYGVLQALRTDGRTAMLPFIFLTAKAERADLRFGMEQGADDYLTKPFTRNEVMSAITARLQRAQKVREQTHAKYNQLKQQISTLLAHELRTPLIPIMGYTDLALDNISALSPEEMLGFLGRIEQGSVRLTRLVENLLMLVQIDTGQILGDFAATVKVCRNLGEVITLAVESYRLSALIQGVSLGVKVDADLPAVRLSQPLFATTFGHLIDNGIKFSKNRLGAVTISVHRAGDGVDIALVDHGVGIPADEIPHLFERLQQIDRATHEQQGSGTGLAIVQELIKLHGGTIRVESVLGSGSTFTIHLPEYHET